MARQFWRPPTSQSILTKTLVYTTLQIYFQVSYSADNADGHAAARTGTVDAGHNLVRREADTVEVRSTGHSQKIHPHAKEDSENKVLHTSHDNPKIKLHERSRGGEHMTEAHFANDKELDTARHEVPRRHSSHDLLEDDYDGLVLEEEDLLDHGKGLGLTEISQALNKKGGGAWFDRRRRAKCMFLTWQEWAGCTVTCGEGMAQRTRMMTVLSGKGCNGPTTQKGACSPRPCPIHCQWNSWSSWTRCPVTCGFGKQTKDRSVMIEAQHGGNQCDDLWLTYQERVCETTPCPIDCEYKMWSEWSDCSLSCGTGQKERSRDKNHSSEHKGEHCPGSYAETQPCNVNNCPVDCEVALWSEWNACSEDCGGGTQERTRGVLVWDKHGGAACPWTQESLKCNEAACVPVKNNVNTMTKVTAVTIFVAVMAITL